MDEKQERKGFYSREEVVAILKDFQEKNNQAVAKSIGNGAKMREALEKIAHYDDSEYGMDDYGCADGHNCADIARKALAEPPRNCDVGTVEEQAKRMDKFCDSHRHGFDGRSRYACENCKFISVDRCELAWAQLPYEEGGAK